MAWIAESSVARPVTTMISGGASISAASRMRLVGSASESSRSRRTSANAPWRISRSPSTPVRATATAYPSRSRKSLRRRAASGSWSMTRMASCSPISLSLSPPGGEHAVLEEDEHQPGQLHTDEDCQAAIPPGLHVRAILKDGAEETDCCERRLVVRGEQAGGHGQAGREAPEDVGREPVGDDGDADRGARTGFAEQPRERDRPDAQEEERGQCRESPASHGFTAARTAPNAGRV